MEINDTLTKVGEEIIKAMKQTIGPSNLANKLELSLPDA